jgi:hypothetical protein
MTLAALGAWLNEEYRRLSARPRRRGDDALVRSGYLAAVAEIEAICKSGKLPQHSPCREEWLFKQAQEARQATTLLETGKQ